MYHRLTQTFDEHSAFDKFVKEEIKDVALDTLDAYIDSLVSYIVILYLYLRLHCILCRNYSHVSFPFHHYLHKLMCIFLYCLSFLGSITAQFIYYQQLSFLCLCYTIYIMSVDIILFYYIIKITPSHNSCFGNAMVETEKHCLLCEVGRYEVGRHIQLLAHLLEYSTLQLDFLRSSLEIWKWFNSVL